MSAHTPGPWRVGSKHPVLGDVQTTDIFTDEPFGDLIASCKTSPPCPQAEANARRIVACVNACEGILTEALEAEPEQRLVKYLSTRKANYLVASLEIGKLMAQRDELLAALEWISENGPDDAYELRERARAALSKATGSEG